MTVFICCFCLIIGAMEEKSERVSEIVGTWKVVSNSVLGDGSTKVGGMVTIDAQSISWTYAETTDIYKLGRDGKHKTIVLLHEDKPYLHGLYDFRDGELVMHLAPSDLPRPESLLPMDRTKRFFIFRFSRLHN